MCMSEKRARTPTPRKQAKRARVIAPSVIKHNGAVLSSRENSWTGKQMQTARASFSRATRDRAAYRSDVHMSTTSSSSSKHNTASVATGGALLQTRPNPSVSNQAIYPMHAYLVVPRGEVGAGVEVHEEPAPEGVPVLRPAEGGVRAVVHHVQQRERLRSQDKRGADGTDRYARTKQTRLGGHVTKKKRGTERLHVCT